MFILWELVPSPLRTLLSSNTERSPTQVPCAPWIIRHFDNLQKITILRVNQITRYCEWFGNHVAESLRVSLKDLYQRRLEQTNWNHQSFEMSQGLSNLLWQLWILRSYFLVDFLVDHYHTTIPTVPSQYVSRHPRNPIRLRFFGHLQWSFSWIRPHPRPRLAMSTLSTLCNKLSISFVCVNYTENVCPIFDLFSMHQKY